MSQRRLRLNIDALIFSIDDVLIDVSYSYREVVRKTVQLYLENAVGLLPGKKPLLTSDEITLLQKVGHFSDYWDLATALIIYFNEMLPPVPVPTFPSRIHVPAIIAYLQIAGGRLNISIDELRKMKDIDKLAKDIAYAGGGIEGANKALSRTNRHLLVASGDITRTNLAGRIFQELYLGAKLFEKIYGQPAVITHTTGYIEHESLLIDRDILEALNLSMPLGLVSNRPRLEVEHSLKARSIEDHFQSILTKDDIQEKKGDPIPSPWPLLETARHLKPTPTHTAYIGANLGDIKAATEANQTVPFKAIGCLAGTYNKEELRQAFEKNKANVILGHPNNLKELLLD